jgi:NAD(P)-dependent dehydrogenase (short-subunit alcohol dehydrogenase family)
VNESKRAIDWLNLAGRVCVVTGAGSGIGAGVARELAAAGASVAVLDLNAGAAAAVALDIQRSGGRAISVAADVSRPDAIVAAAERVQAALGPCHVLVNNAAMVRVAGALMDISLEICKQVLAVNLSGALICTQAFGRQMITAAKGGSIVNVASITGHHPLPNGNAYGVGKSGTMMMSRVLSVELAQHRIRSNVVSPGLVHTRATERAYLDPVTSEQRQKMVPAGRIGDPIDLANIIAFLASDRASYITGQDIVVDGGLSQMLMALVPRAATL